MKKTLIVLTLFALLNFNDNVQVERPEKIEMGMYIFDRGHRK